MRISDWSSDVCSSDLVEMPADDPEIAAVRTEHEIEEIARDRNGAERRVDADIGGHARKLPFRHAEISRLPDEVHAKGRGDDIAGDGHESDEGVDTTLPARAGEREGSLQEDRKSAV